jgi:hypothetical protein
MSGTSTFVGGGDAVGVAGAELMRGLNGNVKVDEVKQLLLRLSGLWGEPDRLFRKAARHSPKSFGSASLTNVHARAAQSCSRGPLKDTERVCP